MLVHNSTDCTASGGLCTCKSSNLTGFPSGSTGVQCSPAGDADGRPISIDSHDASGRKTAENGVTDKTSFVIAINRAEAAKDYVTWSTKVNDTGKVINSTRRAEWNEQQLAYVTEFMFTEDFAFVFVFALSSAVNGQPWQILPNKSPTSREDWQHNRPTDADGDPFSPLWSSTEFKWTG